jgi:tryptophan synthase beta chain
VTRIATETGAGQWGSAMAFAGAYFGLEVKVYMVRASYDQKPYRRILMETYGAEVVASPSPTTNYGRSVLATTPDSPGSLGMAISEAVEDAATRDDTKYSLGSVLNHVLLHQTVIGQEAIEQMGMAGESPDIVIGCTGGGSNFAGLAFPFLGRNFRDGAKHRIIAVEPEAAPSLTRGVYAYDYGDTAKMAPVALMHTLGHDFIPEPIHAGGLRYHGMSPLVSLLKENGYIEARSVHQRASFAAGVQFARAEGILPAPEPTHAIRAAIDEALVAKEAGEARVILFNLCGHGHFDLSAYDDFLAGRLVDHELPQAELDDAAAVLAGMPSTG